MSSSTAKYVIPYPTSSDTVASLATTVQNLAARLDLLLGESGSFNIASAAGGVAGAQAVVLSRTYPGNSGAAVPGIVIPDLVATYASNNRFNWWVDTWTGTGTTITGFTFRYIWETAQTNRVVNWRFLPVL
jgi:hypothetical protein